MEKTFSRVYSAKDILFYMDIVNELEKMGDFIINISQDLLKHKVS